MYLTQKNHLRVDKKTYKTLHILSHLSKDLYNLTLYVTRQHYELNGTFLPYTKAYHILKDSEPYKLLPSQVIPFGLFKQKLRAKCERYGINFY